MELVKVNESVNRIFDGETTREEVTSVFYNIEDNGVSIGTANISQGGFISISAQMSGTMEEIKEKAEALFTE
ncbi:MAG: hypothetical protein GX912_10520 [Gammaproteobacteria bacterium]|nr:hypothetical protein [Gammaproteobacteria bacterium]